MRVLILVAGAAVAISACNSDQPVANTTNVDQDLAAQNISANDTTSIDAATGEDANMAADVDFTLNETDNLAGNEGSAGNETANNETANNAD
ncbi:hypothetical protein [Sphingomonas sp.]|uniref:hypothetical protein n=1 Tax=Sphingomonas sp. TaxID=28214 RepID=UPI0017FBFA83|nr:hypothetical protein [Sphingomonas sp.]MBA3511009.1 hypothetical protein [Sphingomonas sp.]